MVPPLRSCFGSGFASMSFFAIAAIRPSPGNAAVAFLLPPTLPEADDARIGFTVRIRLRTCPVPFHFLAKPHRLQELSAPHGSNRATLHEAHTQPGALLVGITLACFDDRSYTSS